jgi:hypothetical protein
VLLHRFQREHDFRRRRKSQAGREPAQSTIARDKTNRASKIKNQVHGAVRMNFPAQKREAEIAAKQNIDRARRKKDSNLTPKTDRRKKATAGTLSRNSPMGLGETNQRSTGSSWKPVSREITPDLTGTKVNRDE